MNRFPSLSLAALALTLGSVALPAHAQLLGRGGLGGSLGGSFGGAGSLGSTMNGRLGSAGSITDDVSSRTTRTTGTATGSASTTGDQSVNRKTGKVHVDRSANAAGSGNLAGSTRAPLNSATASLGGSGAASGSGSADAQLVGTNGVRNAAQSARSTADSTVGQTRAAATATGTALTRRASGAVSGTSATAVGAAQGSASIARRAASSSLALAGSSAAGVAGATGVKPGMVVRSIDGSKLGKVKQELADESGNVRRQVVGTGAGNVTLPATQLSAQGNGKGLIASGQ